ncbi:hypothetical protein MJ575_14220 [Klebsiella pneumoniae]|nr:hypothetical protein MJ575_14220 [Klebsiella pneumoniae]
MLNSIGLWDSKRHSPRRRAVYHRHAIFNWYGEEKIFISGLEKRTLDVILYSGQAMLAFMLSF